MRYEIRGDEAVFWVSRGQRLAVLSQDEGVIDFIDIGSVEGIDAFICLKSGDLVRCYSSLTDRLTDKERIELLSSHKTRFQLMVPVPHKSIRISK